MFHCQISSENEHDTAKLMSFLRLWFCTWCKRKPNRDDIRSPNSRDLPHQQYWSNDACAQANPAGAGADPKHGKNPGNIRHTYAIERIATYLGPAYCEDKWLCAKWQLHRITNYTGMICVCVCVRMFARACAGRILESRWISCLPSLCHSSHLKPKTPWKQWKPHSWRRQAKTNGWIHMLKNGSLWPRWFPWCMTPKN